MWENLQEDKSGLRVEGQIVLETAQGKDAHALLKAKVVKSLSIGFNAIDFEIDQKKQIRFLKEVDLWEISLVTFPADSNANIFSVKSQIEEAKTERDLERALRDAGLSKSSALYVVSLCRSTLRESKKQTGDLSSQVLKGLREVNAELYVMKNLI